MIRSILEKETTRYSKTNTIEKKLANRVFLDIGQIPLINDTMKRF